VRGVGDIVPDPVHFGVLYVKEEYARDVLDFKDACNQVVGRFMPGTQGEHADLLDRIDRMLTGYGVLEVIPRERQASHRFVSDEIQNLGISATIVPIIFLCVAALILNVLMVRLADRQRTTIGTLKAIGYSDGQVMAHYLSYGAAVGVAGGVAGALLGTTLAIIMIRVYHDFFDFPRFLFSIDPDLILVSFGISVFFAVLGTVRGVWAVLRLQPAEAMRLKPPERGGAIILERWPWLWRRFGFRTHMALRSVFRNRFRTATGIVSTAMAAAIMFMSFALFDAFKYIIDFQFDMTLRSDVDIGMRDEASVAALFESRRLPGVTRAKPMLAVRCDLRHGPNARRMSITGLAPGHALTIPMQSDGTPIDVPEEGLVLSRKLGELLGAGVGDRLSLTPVRGRRETKEVQVASVVDTFLGLDCYADIRYLSGVVGESLAVNAVQLSVEPTRIADLYGEVKDLPNAQGLSVRADSRSIVEDVLIRTQMVFIGIIVLFAGSIAFGSAVNAALVEIGDRIREISTLRVLGYSPSEVTGILVRQEAFVFVCGLALAYPIGYVLVWYLIRAYDTELLRVPFIIRPPILVYTAVMSFSFIIAAQVIVYRHIARLNWLEGIQVKE
jgi:putative ABC transport system permease protein